MIDPPVIQPQEEISIYRSKLREKWLELIPIEAAEIAGDDFNADRKKALQEAINRLNQKIEELSDES